jgi:chaperonin GroEL (HSP60 family)
MASLQTAPSLSILKKGYGRAKDARRANMIIMGKVSDAIKPALGPNGMSKMLVAPMGGVSITNDGRAILENMQTMNEITKLMIELARTQSDIAGDGTKTAVVLTGELLKKADNLLKMKVHPRVIIEGYKKAGKRALQVLVRSAVDISVSDEASLLALTKTTIGGRITGESKERLARLTTSAIRAVAETSHRKTMVDVDDIVIRKKAGASTNESELVRGLIIYKDKPHPSMPERIEGARVALIGSAIDPFIYETGDPLREYEINTPEQLRSFKDGESRYYQGIVNTLKRTGASALFCQKRVSKAMQAFLAEARILAFDLVSDRDMVRLAKTTCAQIVTKPGELGTGDIGLAGLLEFRNISGDKMLFVEQCPCNRAVTLLIRGGSEQVVEELEGIMNQCVKTVAIAVENGKALYGGGAVEMEIWKALKGFSSTITNKEQLAVEVYADAIEEIPKALVSNAGMDCVDALTELRSKHERGLAGAGIQDALGKARGAAGGTPLDSFKAKQHAIKIATETATLVLGISDIIMVTNPAAIKRAETDTEMEQKRIQDEKLRVAFKEKESLKEVTKLDREMMDRVMHPDTY